MAKDYKRLGEMLIEAELITTSQLEHAIKEQKKSGRLIGAVLTSLGFVGEREMMQVLQRQLALPLVDLTEAAVDEQALQKIREDLAKKYMALPMDIEGRRTLVVAMADPLNAAAIEDLRFSSGMFIRPVLALPSQIAQAIERFYHLDTSMNEVIRNLVKKADDIVVNQVSDDEENAKLDEQLAEVEGRPIIKLLNWVLSRSVEMRASDIHIEPQDKELAIRVRVDGLLQELERLPKWTQSALVSRIKVLSNMDIAEKRLPQDGRLRIEIGDTRAEMRVSTLPITNGEKVVIRIIDQRSTILQLEEIGFAEADLTRVRTFLDRPQGIVLVTGPTGSGKSTLLYAGLRYIQHITKNIVTVEDPVERQVVGINQVQVDEKAKKTFANALRAILRQDPDVVMLGEIRDRETAQIAFRAANTGHLVLSTVHTNDASSAVTRLMDLGLEAFMVASSLLGVINMRLVRMLCTKCREPYQADAATLNRFSTGIRPEGTVTLYRGRGCPNCNETGYRGRTGIFEVLAADDHVRALVQNGANDMAIRQAALDNGMHTIGEDGLRKVLTGITTLDEVSRVVYLANQAGKVCPSCSEVLNQEFEYCSACGDFVGEHCRRCRRRVSASWTFCPHCGMNSGNEESDEKTYQADHTGPGHDRRRSAPPGQEDLRQAS
jgi:type IV pilus assembly protein PilB